ncbi:S-adenosyl-L-methionine-dependent methyltransferase [Cercophora newfieldiana]|uniref:S-adenosyl-L-methionine-dependent methyltransferase n=1 Tax=Cercophora newfieldiana TaxID=92897 RepID=A0AA39YAS4_9PEZI|nr:S-adenosyl-L-methionine-dependent methyltransferase [Cercophora newfieldiana]
MSTPRRQTEALFDEVGATYEEVFADLQPIHAAIQWVLSELSAANIHPAKTVDIGCGTGRPICSSLAQAGHDVLGIDISGSMIAEAQKRVPLPNATFTKIDTLEFNPPPGSFDVVTLTFSLIAGVTQDEIRQVIAKLYAMLKPGGLLVFATVPVEGNNVEIKWMGRPVTVSSLSPGDTVGEIKKVGFEIVKEEESKYHPIKASSLGLCGPEDVWEETHLWVYARKPVV